MPAFPDNPEDVAVYRRWYKELATHCERTNGFEKANLVFRYLKSWPNPLTNDADLQQVLKKPSGDEEAES